MPFTTMIEEVILDLESDVQDAFLPEEEIVHSRGKVIRKRVDRGAVKLKEIILTDKQGKKLTVTISTYDQKSVTLVCGPAKP